VENVDLLVMKAIHEFYRLLASTNGFVLLIDSILIYYLGFSSAIQTMNSINL